ncbi:MAG: metallophosphoesterase family protein [Planctomycetota bacterium]|nr:metallophosphoesterase family protein [Planctomycetota bacterium]
MTRRKIIKAAYVTDPHCPFQNSTSVYWALGQIREYKPDYLIMGGDLFEASAASRFENEDKHDLRDDYRAGARLLDALADAGAGADLVWCRGNHDDNIACVGRIQRGLRSQVHWSASEWADSFRRWKQIPYDYSADGCFQLGQVMFWHGFHNEEMDAIKLNNMTGGHAHRLVVGGHTHRPHGPTQVMRTKKVPLPLWYANGGTLGPTRPAWTQRQDTSGWKAGFVMVELTAGRACQPGRNWDCVVEVMK